MRNTSLDAFTETVIDAIQPDVPARTREVLTSLIRHLHAFAREVSLTHEEWLAACEFFVRAGHKSDERRNEFILLSDIVGLEVLIDRLHHRSTEGETEATVLGPFYREGAPAYPNGASIVQAPHPDAETVLVEGTVRGTRGKPVAGAVLDVWETNANGLYEQQDESQPDMNLRGRFETDQDGRYAFRCIRPVSYPIPFDGPGGDLLTMMARTPMRPGHLHFLIRAEGCQPLVTQIYDAEDPYLDKDAVFAVKDSLIGRFEKAPEGSDTDLTLRFDFALKPAAEVAARAA